ncbi:MAG: acyl-CoA dehydrogenase family protein, partial [Deltaproteobacteria bacterium]|nr:acyl-CoA dehydrogenase family protein [Deltaproteobacteria bacterium]
MQTEDKTYQKYFNKQHDLLRKAVRDFVKKEITPHVDEWEEAGEFPRELHKKVADLGFNGILYPVEYGGSDGDWFEHIVVVEEFGR